MTHFQARIEAPGNFFDAERHVLLVHGATGGVSGEVSGKNNGPILNQNGELMPAH
ncbi:hypothetical protein PT2222_30250 [Paraburkholderia tropica]